MLILAQILATSLAAGWLTNQVRRYAIGRGLVDIPGERSSHLVPTPRGGGLAIVLITLGAILMLGAAGQLQFYVLMALLFGGIVVAGVGVLDDHGHAPPLLRLLVHISAGIWVCVILYPFPPLIFAEADVQHGWIPLLFGIFWVTWVINLYNFMDGIDGLAGVEAVTVCFGAAVLLHLADQTGQALLLVTAGSASAGFLYWNWPPARVHMGDSGSGFLGFLFAAMALIAHSFSALDFWIWPILLGVFIVDATVTLIHRVVRLERFYVAHRSHAYQHAAKEFGAHWPVTVAVTGINVLWLFPISVLVFYQVISGVMGMIIAYIPLLLLAFRFRAGDTRYRPV